MAGERLARPGREFDNTEIVKKIANTRLKIANLLGYKCYADYVLEERMAGSTATVEQFLDEAPHGDEVVGRCRLPHGGRVCRFARFPGVSDALGLGLLQREVQE